MVAKKRKDITREVKSLEDKGLEASQRALEVADLATKAEKTLKALGSGLTTEVEQTVNHSSQQIQNSIGAEYKTVTHESEQSFTQLEKKKNAFEYAISADREDLSELNQLRKISENKQINGEYLQQAENEKLEEIRFLADLVDSIESTQVKLQKISEFKSKRKALESDYAAHDLYSEDKKGTRWTDQRNSFSEREVTNTKNHIQVVSSGASLLRSWEGYSQLLKLGEFYRETQDEAHKYLLKKQINDLLKKQINDQMERLQKYLFEIREDRVEGAKYSAKTIKIDESIKSIGIEGLEQKLIQYTQEVFTLFGTTPKLQEFILQDPRPWAYDNKINIGTYRDYKSTIYHEIGHFIEFSNLSIKKAAVDWIMSRATGTEEKLSQLTGINDYKDDETAYPDHFFDPYVGKIYSDGWTEVVSMGIESFSNPSMMTLLFLNDIEHFYFILGLVK